jgi:PEP-CTERM motif
MLRSRAFLVFFVGILFLAIPCRAMASPVWFEFGPVDQADIVSLSYTTSYNTKTPDYVDTNVAVYAGQYGGQVSSSSSMTDPTSFYTFCVDMAHDVSVNQIYQVTPYNTSFGANPLPDGNQIAYLFKTYGTNLITSSSSVVTSSNSNPYKLSAADYAAALQLAIWDELVNDGLDFGPNNPVPNNYDGSSLFTWGISSSYPNGVGNLTEVEEQVQWFLTQAENQTADEFWLQSQSSPGYPQGQGFLLPTGNATPQFTPAPEPASLTMLGTGFLAVIGYRFRRRRRESA